MASLGSVRYAVAKGIDMKSIILLRGINVGGHGQLPMKELCAILESLGAQNPQTYIQSGNAVVEGGIEAEKLSDAIENFKGFRPSVLVFPVDEFTRIVAQPPLDEPVGKLVHIWFPATAFTFDQEKADSLIVKTESLHIAERAIWLHAPNGVGRSKLAANIEALAGAPCTARNMNTVRKLREMLDG